MKPSRGQIAALHVLKAKLGMDDETYRAMLRAEPYRVSSSKDLTSEQMHGLLKALAADAEALGVWTQRQGKRKPRFSNMADRKGMATPDQLRMLEGKWMQVTRMQDEESARKAFAHFINKQWRIARLEWLPAYMVGKVCKVLNVMIQNKESKRVSTDKGEIGNRPEASQGAGNGVHHDSIQPGTQDVLGSSGECGESGRGGSDQAGGAAAAQAGV